MLDKPLKDRVADLERMLSFLGDSSHGTAGQVGKSWQVRIGKTQKKNEETYPSSGNVLPFVFLDAEFDEIAGHQPLTAHERTADAKKVAYSFLGYLEENVTIVVFYLRKRWWIIGLGETLSSSDESSSSFESSSSNESNSAEESSGGSGDSHGSGGSGGDSDSNDHSQSGESSGGSRDSQGSEISSGESRVDSDGDSGSEKNPAIVPAPWTEGGYTEMYTFEMDRVYFGHVVEVSVRNGIAIVPIDPRHLAICNRGTFKALGANAADDPVAVSATVKNERLCIKTSDKTLTVKVTVMLLGIRRGMGNLHFRDVTRAEYEANEKFLKMRLPKNG
jgi:hypothetical protein